MSEDDLIIDLKKGDCDIIEPRLNLLVALEYRFKQNEFGEICSDNHYDYRFWKRYLNSFDEVVVLARLSKKEPLASTWQRVEGERVRVVGIPDFNGPWEYLSKRKSVLKYITEAISETNCTLLRVPGQIGTLVELELKRIKRSFALEIVGDPWESFAPGNVKSWLTPIFRFISTHRLRRQCLSSVANAYVTAERLQRRYPAQASAIVTNYSSISLSKEAYAVAPRIYDESFCNRLCKILFVGSLSQNIKGLDTLMKALCICNKRGALFELNVVGGGEWEAYFRNLANDLILQDKIIFHGQLSTGEPVYERMRNADLFVLPSYAEGLPRAMIEAMAMGMPCIGTSVGGGF